MLSETKLIIHKLKTEGIGTSVASMHRGLDLLSQLIECEPEVAIKYFKGVAAACEHISGIFLGENYVPTKGSTNQANITKTKVVEQTMPKNPFECASFLLDGMKDGYVNSSSPNDPKSDPKIGMTPTAAAAESIL